MQHTTTVVVGAGQSGLASSYALSARGIDHVVLERRQVANAWRTERWDSLRLLTPNWQCRLPGLAYDGDDPDGFMHVSELADFLDRYAERIAAPIVTGAAVTAVEQHGDGYSVQTPDETWQCSTVVLASGAFNVPHVPAFAVEIPATVRMVTPSQYRNPADLPAGGVLVVGASATGVQIAHEIRASGRAVTLAVGEHVRGPREYRGRDIHWWMEAAGVLDERYDEVDDIVRARRVPSMQLVGSPDRRTLDLNALRDAGIRVVGRLQTIRDGHALFSGSLRNKCSLADLKLGRLLDTIDHWAEASGVADDIPPPHRFEPTLVDDSPVLDLDLRSGEIDTIVWATGFRPDYGWLHLPVLDAKGQIRHDGGVVTDAPGMYVIGTPFLRRRKSTFVDGTGQDAVELVEHLAAHLDGTARPAPPAPPRAVDLRPARRPNHYDLVIAGARCAGAATAMLAARAGARVLVLERGRAGSDTLSTHALMRAGVLQLARWDVLPAIVEAGTPPVRTVVFDYPDERVPVEIRPSPGVDALYAPRRTVLDPSLVDAARAAGAEVRFGVTVTGLLEDGARVAGVVARDADGRERRFTADLVVGADGRRSTIARLVDAELTHAGTAMNGTIYSYWEGVEAAGYEWCYRPGFAAGVIATNDDRVLAFGALTPEEFDARATGDLEGAFRATLAERAPELLERLDAGTRVEPFHGYRGAPGYMRRPWGPGWALVGDAGYLRDPITVHGITDALRDAELLSRAIAAGADDASLRRYESERDRVSQRLFDVTELIAGNRWTMTEIRGLLREMSQSMAAEVALLEGAQPIVAPADA